MLRKIQLCLVCAVFTFVLSGCVVRTYRLTRDRVDQNLESGNRGYLIGKPSAEELSKPRKATRTTRIVEVEMLSALKSDQQTTERPVRTAPVMPARRIQEDYTREYTPPVSIPRIERVVEPAAPAAMQKYTIMEGDTLQKVSQKFFGTTKKWYEIYKANQDTLKGPDKIYPGQVINIPGVSTEKSGLK